MQLRMSPGGRMRFSRRNRPELPPSSVTVTMAVRSAMGRSRGGTDRGGANDVLLEAAQEGGETGAAAEGDDAEVREEQRQILRMFIFSVSASGWEDDVSRKFIRKRAYGEKRRIAGRTH